jgi:hypothetical protein
MLGIHHGGWYPRRGIRLYPRLSVRTRTRRGGMYRVELLPTEAMTSPPGNSFIPPARHLHTHPRRGMPR